MMEEVSNIGGGGSSLDPPVSSSDLANAPPPQQFMTPPSQAYMATPVVTTHSTPPSPVPTNYSPSTVSDSMQGSYQASASSMIVMPNMPEYEDQQKRHEGSSDGGGMWGWFKSASQNTFVQSVVEKTKTSVDKVITTLDPGMTPYLRQGGDISVVVTSAKEVKWGAVREAFQKVFGMAHVTGIAAQSGVAPQPVSYAAGLRGAQDRISYLRRSGLIESKQVCVSVENFIAELLPDKWFDIGCIILDDPALNINLEMFTQAVPLPADIINHIQSATPHDYSLSWSGLSVTTGQAFQHHMPWINPTDWHKSLTGQSRKEMIYSATLTLAGLYKEKLPQKSPAISI